MPIDRKRRIIFIHIPKNAGTSIEKALGIYGEHTRKSEELVFGTHHQDNERYALQHIGMSQLFSLNMISYKESLDYFSFCIVRNPWERAVSDYKWQKRIRKQDITFKQYLYRAKEFKEKNEESRLINYENCHYIPQSWYVFDQDGNTEVDYIGRFERFDESLKKVRETTKLSNIELNSGNKGKSDLYHLYYRDLRNFQLVREIYKEDIEMFDYTFFKSNAIEMFMKKVRYIFLRKLNFYPSK